MLNGRWSYRRLLGALGALSCLAALCGPPAAASELPTLPTLFGVDTASSVDPAFLSAVDATVGEPTFVGRYVASGTAVGAPLSAGEVEAVHRSGAAVMIITSPADGDLVGAGTAADEAAAAVGAARALGAPTGVAIFRDVEWTYEVSAAYVAAWDSAVAAAGYAPGFYESSLRGAHSFDAAYCAAVAADPALARRTVLYAAIPRRTGYLFPAASRPRWSPATPPCRATTVAWQYKEDFGSPNIDVDEVTLAGVPDLWWPG